MRTFHASTLPDAQSLPDEERHQPVLAREDELTICGRVRAWMSVKGY